MLGTGAPGSSQPRGARCGQGQVGTLSRQGERVPFNLSPHAAPTRILSVAPPHPPAGGLLPPGESSGSSPSYKTRYPSKPDSTTRLGGPCRPSILIVRVNPCLGRPRTHVEPQPARRQPLDVSVADTYGLSAAALLPNHLPVCCTDGTAASAHEDALSPKSQAYEDSRVPVLRARTNKPGGRLASRGVKKHRLFQFSLTRGVF